MNIRKLEDLSKEELIELVKHERDHIAQPRKMAPEGWKLVPVEPTYDMTQAGVNLALSARISGAYPWPTYIQDMYKAMLAAAPDHIPDAGNMTPTVKQSLTAEPTDSEMLDWLIENEALICYSSTNNLYEVWFGFDDTEIGETAREAIKKAMRGEE